MLEKRELEAVLNRAMSAKGDFAELYFENTEELQITAEDGNIQGKRTVEVSGAGLYLLNGNSSIYVYSSRTDYASLQHMAEVAAELMPGFKEEPKQRSICLDTHMRPAFVPYKEEKCVPQIIEMMRETDASVRGQEYHLQNLLLQFFFSNKKIQIVNSDGLYAWDQRPTTRLRYRMTVGEGTDNTSRFDDIFKSGSFENFLGSGENVRFAQSLAEKLNMSRRAKEIPPCCVPIVMDGGICATLFHECLGHAVEGNNLRKGNSIFIDKLGEMVASSKVTVYDDATFPGALATSRIDDEGMESRKIALIENGVLKNFLLDRLSARILGMECNACGRRQNYMFAPASRMSNTYLAPGEDDPDQMVRDIEKGLFVTGCGGGVEGEQFCMALQDAFWIENGEITYPVKDINLTGNGIEIMKKIDRVGTKFGEFDGGFCGSVSGIIPTTTNQPRIRILDVNLG